MKPNAIEDIKLNKKYTPCPLHWIIQQKWTQK